MERSEAMFLHCNCKYPYCRCWRNWAIQIVEPTTWKQTLYWKHLWFGVERVCVSVYHLVTRSSCLLTVVASTLFRFYLVIFSFHLNANRIREKLMVVSIHLHSDIYLYIDTHIHDILVCQDTSKYPLTYNLYYISILLIKKITHFNTFGLDFSS